MFTNEYQLIVIKTMNNSNKNKAKSDELLKKSVFNRINDSKQNNKRFESLNNFILLIIRIELSLSFEYFINKIAIHSFICIDIYLTKF